MTASEKQKQTTRDDDLSIVCIGASAGGFDAYCTILGLLPADTGLSFIIVHHQPETGIQNKSETMH
jgi:chemotaxis response regulator CheB